MTWPANDDAGWSKVAAVETAARMVARDFIRISIRLTLRKGDTIVVGPSSTESTQAGKRGRLKQVHPLGQLLRA